MIKTWNQLQNARLRFRLAEGSGGPIIWAIIAVMAGALKDKWPALNGFCQLVVLMLPIFLHPPTRRQPGGSITW